MQLLNGYTLLINKFYGVTHIFSVMVTADADRSREAEIPH